MCTSCSDSKHFKMGAAVAVGELFGLGRFGSGEAAADDARSFLMSFSIKGIDDVAALEITGPYVDDLMRIFGCAER